MRALVRRDEPIYSGRERSGNLLQVRGHRGAAPREELLTSPSADAMLILTADSTAV
jgi:hypothetical protein